MPHAIKISSIQSKRASKNKSPNSSRDLRQLQTLYAQTQEHYLTSALYLSISQLLDSKTRPRVTRIISLGLGSLKSTDQTRRLKQLTIFLAIASQLKVSQPELGVYAQDPSFSKLDETFLNSLGVKILSTPAATEAGEAADYINEQTLVYCPFLTLEAYQLFFEKGRLGFFVGDDFDALRSKWPKYSQGRNETEALIRRWVQGGLRKRAVPGGEDFWEVGDKPFPMALYWDVGKGREVKAKL